MSTQGQLFVVCAPSGAGKTSLVNRLVKQVKQLQVSISYTTRPKRTREKDGVNYFFVETQEFESLTKNQKMLEYANVFGHLYGTSKEWVESELAKGQDIILEIDWQGAEQVRKNFPESVHIFILPPSMDSLKERITKRGQDKPDVIERRLNEAHEEMTHVRDFDYIVVNDQYSVALAQLKSIIYAERTRTKRQVQHQAKLLKQLDI